MRIWFRVGLRARNMAEPHVHVPCVQRDKSFTNSWMP